MFHGIHFRRKSQDFHQLSLSGEGMLMMGDGETTLVWVREVNGKSLYLRLSFVVNFKFAGKSEKLSQARGA